MAEHANSKYAKFALKNHTPSGTLPARVSTWDRQRGNE
jgi:hypothetical protein